MANGSQVACGLLFMIAALPVAAGEKVSFNRDIRPIMSDTCRRCATAVA